MKQHWRRSADGHIDAGDLDASGASGPGTESNRARAARNGFTFTMPSEPGTVIARLDTTGPEPVGSVSRDGGQTWEDAPRWPAGATTAHTATGGPVTLGASDGGGPRPLPATLAEAERLYGKGSPVWEAVRWQAKQPAMEIRDVAKQDLPPMTWGGVPVPFERVDTARAPAHAQPDPAPGQVWLPPPGEQPTGWLAPDGTLTVEAVADDGQEVRFAPVDPGRSATYVHAPTMARWTCIGVATPHGRVMVGDGFRLLSNGNVYEVSAISGGPAFWSGGVPQPFEVADMFSRAWERARYAPARAGERYRDRRNGDVKSIGPGAHEIALPLSAHGGMDPAQWERIDAAAAPVPAALPSLTRDGWTAEVRSNAITPGDNGARFVMHVTSPSGHTFAGPFDQWNVVVPGAKPQSAAELADFLGFCMAGVEAEGQSPRDGQTIRFKRPVSVVEAERARAVGAADAETDEALRARCQVFDRQRHLQWRAPGLDTAKGAALDAIAAGMGIERRAAVQPSGVATDALGRELASDYGGNIKGPPSVDMTVDHPRCRSVLVGTVDPGATLTLTGPARDLRALADAVGRALESTRPHHATFSGYIVRVQRDELLFSPTYSTGSGAALAGDTRALAALRRVLLDAVASDDGRATLAQWGAKGPALVVRREYRFEPAPAAERDPSPTRYDGANGGADQWRWEVGE